MKDYKLHNGSLARLEAKRKANIVASRLELLGACLFCLLLGAAIVALFTIV